MSRKNYTHTMDAFIHGYSNFTFTPPVGTTTTTVRSEIANAPMAFDETANKFTTNPEPVLITPTLETVKPTYVAETPILAPIYEEAKPVAPIISIIGSTPTYVTETPAFIQTYDDDVRPPAPTPTPTPTPVYVKPEATPTLAPIYEEQTPVFIDSKSISEKEQDRNVAPIINVVNTAPYVAPPLIIGGGGGGGAMGETRKPLSGSTTVEKPSFIKKNFIPILLIASAIYVFIKKPIK